MPYNPSVVEKYLTEVKRKRTTSGSKEVEWKVVKVPKQPGNVECGYYVLRFMKEIVENPAILTEKFNGKTIYTQDI
ncbi:hypothetical protein EZV62_018903 [Acer yangbiense]|uniref:Ubiquitin-like protease family profile domain-containing protein n=1 Tax=Acer yangbiense TaxID=1000413 RepID=A0A5C7H9Q5_9ROSI|nr:hypothetical protein EZV62_018903 [Acer yangbiense]